MIVYKVFCKNYELRKGEFVGTLIERRKDLRGKTQIESGLRWARFSFTDLVTDRQAIFVVPDELMPGSVSRWMMEKGVFTKEELHEIIDLAGQHTKRKAEERSSSAIRQRPVLREANRGQEWKGGATKRRQNPFS